MIDPESKENDRPTFQPWARLEIIWIQGHFDEESLKALALKSSGYQRNILAVDGGGVKSDGLTMVELIMNYIMPSTIVVTDRYCKIIQIVASKGIATIL